MKKKKGFCRSKHGFEVKPKGQSNGKEKGVEGDGWGRSHVRVTGLFEVTDDRMTERRID